MYAKKNEIFGKKCDEKFLLKEEEERKFFRIFLLPENFKVLLKEKKIIFLRGGEGGG